MKKFILKKRVLIPLCVVILLVGVCVWYVNDYYHSDESVKDYLAGSELVSVIKIDEGLFLDGPGTEAALVFYPGAKVEYDAYAPLFLELTGQGVDCFLIKMPCNLAIFGQNMAEDIMSEYIYEQWYMAGHSFGGAIISNYAYENFDMVDGIIFLASYPMKELKQEGFKALSIYGSEDKVLTFENLVAGREQMPADYTEICIEGGNHAYFGNYGEQKGDGTAVISREEQQAQTVDAILKMIWPIY